MNRGAMIVSLSDGIVITTGHEHPEPRPVPGAVAKPWGACTIPGCTHQPPCPAKLRAWASYGRRYTCDEPGCTHRDCPPKRRAEEDHQPFGVPYKGPALPQHVVDTDHKPLGPAMVAVQDADGAWRLWPVRGRATPLDA
jgi:hypothetical protein